MTDDALATLRARTPLVMCITNYVATTFAANVLLAAGASPAMMHAPEETADFAAIADALTINMGTVTPAYIEGMEAAARAAAARAMPWVLDPVAHFATPYRRDCVARLMALRPAVVRGNASEILALAGESSAGKGVDSGDDVAVAAAAADRLARETGAVVAVTGAEDHVTDGTRHVRIRGGSPLMPQVTAMGCAATALVGGYLGAGLRPFEATAAALAHFAEAGARAAATAAGPGSFAPAFLDALAAATPASLAPRIAENLAA